MKTQRASRTGKRIVWAVDPSAADPGMQRAAARAIRSLAKSGDCRIEPVYLWGSYLVAMVDGSLDDIRDLVWRDAQRHLDEIVRGIDIAGLQPLTVLVEPYSDTKRDAGALIAHAKKTGAELIVLSTHGRRGPKRMLAGSFAETLMLTSEIPLLVVSPKWGARRDFREIIFATDFSGQSMEAFEKVVDLASSLGKEIVLFHKVNNPLTPGTEMVFRNFRGILRFFEEDIARRRKLAEEWSASAGRRGVRVRIHIDSAKRGSAADSILKYVKRRPALIAMTSHSGPFTSAFLGSTCRAVVRAAQVPVWVIHPKLEAEQPILRVSEAEIMDDLTRHGWKGAA